MSKYSKLTAKLIMKTVDCSERTAYRIKNEIKELYPDANYYNKQHLEQYLE